MVISGDDTFREGFFNWEQQSRMLQRQHVPQCEVVRIALDKHALKKACKAKTLFEHEIFKDQRVYDLIIVADIFETKPIEATLQTLAQLLQKAKKQVLIAVPELCKSDDTVLNEGLQKYHPVVFKDFDFSYLLLGRKHENRVQLYSFFPNAANLENRETPPKKEKPATASKKLLRLAYILPDQDITGGMKQLLLQAQEMHKRGHHVALYTKSDTASAVIPPWSDLTEEDISEQHVLKMDDDYLAEIEDVDVAILGWMEQVPAFRRAKFPVVLWEQGSRPIFGDFVTPLASASKRRAAFRSYYRYPMHLMAVSPLVQSILLARFGRHAQLVPAAVSANTSQPEIEEGQPKRILLVGDGNKDFKNFSFAIEALELAVRKGEKFVISWATPTQPLRDMVPKGMRIDYHIAPSQEKLAALYKSSDLLLSHSLYEAFCLPPLEAMAAGTAVLAINNGGIETYATSGENCLLCQQGDLNGFVKGIRTLLHDEALRERLTTAGLATASEFSVSAMCDSMETGLYQFI